MAGVRRSWARRTVNAALAAACVDASLVAASVAQEAPQAIEARPHCLWLPGVRDTDVIDNYSVLFRMKDGRVFRMRLAFECYGLKFDESFYYEVTGSRLCDSDTITARSGFSCPIDSFELVVPPNEEKEGR